jgi:hypothetical protein
MKKVFIGILLIGLISSAQPNSSGSTALGEYFPLSAAPENHKILLENEFVLVLDVSIPPGVTVPAHLHPWPAVFITLEQAHLAFRDRAGGLIRDVQPKIGVGEAPLVEWREPDREPVTVTNLSDHAQRAIRVEMKFLGP